MELLVWYGGQYAEQLGISKQRTTSAPKNSTYKFPGMFIEGLKAYFCRFIGL